MPAINVANVSIDIPIYDVSNASIRKLVLGTTIGGRFAESHNHLVMGALKNISFDMKEGDRVGLIGANGSGKTTLLRVLSGVYPPTSGTVKVDGHVSPLFDLNLGMGMDATGFENIRMCGSLWGNSRRGLESRIDEIAEFTELGVYLDMPVRTYSSGMRLRLAFAIATARDPEILLIDEAIGAGDAIFMEKAFARLENLAQRSSILVVATHAEAIINKLCNKAMWLHRGNLIKYGDVNEVLAGYQALRDDPSAAARISA